MKKYKQKEVYHTDVYVVERVRYTILDVFRIRYGCRALFTKQIYICKQAVNDILLCGKSSGIRKILTC